MQKLLQEGEKEKKKMYLWSSYKKHLEDSFLNGLFLNSCIYRMLFIFHRVYIKGTHIQFDVDKGKEWIERSSKE